MNYYVYILKDKDGYNYTGLTCNLIRRLKQHKNGIISCLKNKRPVKLIFYCCFNNKKLAVKFEKYLKTNSGRTFRNKRLIACSAKRSEDEPR